MHLPDPDFPPILTGYAVKAPAAAFATACRRAAARELGATDLVWARATDRAEMALILEPEVTRRQCREIKPLFFNAIADALGALMPPKTAIHLRWPDSVLINGAVAGDIQFATEPGDPGEVPDWLVVGARIRVLRPHSDQEPGDTIDITSVRDEGGAEVDRTQILRSLSAHMLSWLHIWQDDGFRAASDQFVHRVEGHEDEAKFNVAGETLRARVLGLSDDMQLLIRLPDGKTVALDDRAFAAETGVGSAK